MYKNHEQQEIILEYFASTSEEKPRCPLCGEILRFQAQYPTGDSPYRLEVRCPDCLSSFIWEQIRKRENWKPLDLSYCLECHRQEKVPRCPMDDSYIICSQFNNSTVEFRCPYCNRSGRIQICSDPSTQPGS